MDWRIPAVLASLAMAGGGAWLLAESPVSTSDYRAWRPVEPVVITEETGNRTWAWSFRLPNDSDKPLHVEVGYLFNVSNYKAEQYDDWQVDTRLFVDGELEDGMSRGGTGCCGHTVYLIGHAWTIPPGGESFIEATAQNVHTRPGIDWQVDYDPMEFRVTTTTRSLDWTLAGPGAGLLLGAFVVLAVVTMPWRLAR